MKYGYRSAGMLGSCQVDIRKSACMMKGATNEVLGPEPGERYQSAPSKTCMAPYGHVRFAEITCDFVQPDRP